MFRELYEKVLKLASHPHAEMWLFAVAFAESSFFPIPPDVLLIPMVIVNFDRAFRYALICTAGSVLGGVAGFMIGSIFYDTLGTNIISFYGMDNAFDKFKTWYAEYDIYIIGVAGFSPIPYKIFTIASGMLQADLMKFVIASTISRGARFFIISWLLWRGGASFKGWIEHNFKVITMVVSAALILAIVLLKFMVEL
jgi:membrane protein YqaA with SNARE-associated domain